jgi:hypothetical protein
MFSAEGERVSTGFVVGRVAADLEIGLGLLTSVV